MDIEYNLRDFTSFDGGTIDSDGTTRADSKCVRTRSFITGLAPLGTLTVSAHAYSVLDWSGDPNGDDTMKIPAANSGVLNISTYIGDPRYELQYYHFMITNSEFENPVTETHEWRDGCIVIITPKYGSALSDPRPLVVTYQNVAYAGGASGSKSTRAEAVDVGGNSITYYSGSTLVTNYLAQFILGTVLTYDPLTCTYSASPKATRSSTIVALDAAILRYRSQSSPYVVVEDNRWVTEIDYPYQLGAPLLQYKIVLRNANQPGISNNLTSDFLVDANIIMSGDTWRLANDVLTRNELPAPIDGEIIVYPYPAAYWQLGIDERLTMTLLPQPINTYIFVYPYPASLWWYDTEVERLRNMLLPDELLPPIVGGAFYHAENLEYVKIPRSVTSIGQTAFEGTQVKEVCISRNCKYSKSSFPQNCKIVFYEDMYDENYRITVSGVNSYRFTETITHDEESITSEIP